MKEILDLTEAYPEGPVDIEMGFTPIHAAAYAGDPAKLEILLTDYKNAALRVDDAPATGKKSAGLKRRKPWTDAIQSTLMSSKYKEYETKVLAMKKHAKSKAFLTGIFWPKIKRMTRTNRDRFYDMEAYEFETPLHLAAHKTSGEG